MICTVLAGVSLAIWIYLLAGRGGFWRVRTNLLPRRRPSESFKKIVAVIPARDEAEHIGHAVKSLLNQTVTVDVVVVDDSSSDGTADMARRAAAEVHASERLTILLGKALVAGWTGKLWAVSQGVEYALLRSPDYLLLTDSDIEHGPDNAQNLLAVAESGGCDLTSLMVKLTCTSAAEKLLIPAFVFFFFQLYPPAWIEDAKERTAGAAGGCMLVTPSALAGVGGIAAIREEVIDDCALARAIKRSGRRIWLGLTDDAFSIRPYKTFSEVGRMISRSAFNQLQHSTSILVGTVAALLLTYLVPIISMACAQRSASLLGLAAWLVMIGCYLPMVRFYQRSWIWALTLPIAALFYLGATLHSAVSYWCGRGGVWKGRVQDARK